MDAFNTTVGMTQDLLKSGRRFFARASPALPTLFGAHDCWTTCKPSHIWSVYAEPVVHLTQNVAYFAKEAPNYYEASGSSSV